MSRHAVLHLVRSCKDSSRGYATAAACVSDAALRHRLLGLSQQRVRFARALELAALARGRRLRSGGSLTAAVHRAWIRLTSMFAGERDEAVLRACHWADGLACDVYYEALRITPFDSDVRKMIKLQLEVIENGRHLLAAGGSPERRAMSARL